jgi:hypothetical protein
MLAQDLAGLLAADRVDALALQAGQGAEHPLCHVGIKRQRLVGGDEGVVAEQRYEPGNAGGDHGVAVRGRFALDAQGREVTYAALVGTPQHG